MNIRYESTISAISPMRGRYDLYALVVEELSTGTGWKVHRSAQDCDHLATRLKESDPLFFTPSTDSPAAVPTPSPSPSPSAPACIQSTLALICGVLASAEHRARIRSMPSLDLFLHHDSSDLHLLSPAAHPSGAAVRQPQRTFSQEIRFRKLSSIGSRRASAMLVLLNDEVLLGEAADAVSPILCKRLPRINVLVKGIRICPRDAASELADMAHMLEAYDLVFMCGEPSHCHAAVASALGLPLTFCHELPNCRAIAHKADSSVAPLVFYANVCFLPGDSTAMLRQFNLHEDHIRREAIQAMMKAESMVVTTVESEPNLSSISIKSEDQQL